MKILFINDQFERGGAGRVAAILCNELHRRGHEVVLVVDSLHWKETYPIDKDIPVSEIVTKTVKPGSREKAMKWLRCAKAIRRYIKQELPDVVIATQSMMFLCTYLANLGMRTPVIAADHTSFTRKIDPIIDFVRYHLYSRADGLSILTQKDFDILGKKYPKKKVIYNPLSFSILRHDGPRRKNILCAGRLEVWDVKGFDIIINIWSHICQKYPDWTLEIAGPGTETATKYVRKLISDNKVENRIVLLGQVDAMQQLYAESSIFALSSRMEGFPMVLMEAMSQGCACVAFDVGGSSSEMMDAESGIVVKDGDMQGFEDSLRKLLDSEILRRSYSLNARAAVEKFSVKSFVDSWEELMEQVACKKGKLL